MRTISVVTLALVLGCLTPGAPASIAQTTAGTTRALWVWSVQQQPADIVTVATAHGISSLFVSVPAALPSSPELPAISALVADARAAGLRVDALGGDPTWIDNPTWVVDNWLRPALATGLFTGVHADIEPWTTPAWATRQSTVVRRYLATLDQLRLAAGSRPVEVDLPFWAHEIPAGNRSTMSREALRRSAGASIMAYRNTAEGQDGTLAIAAAALADGDTLGKPIRIGQETNYLGPEPWQTKQTFFGMTQAQMDEQFALIDAGAGWHRSYAGVAIHDYTGYAALAQPTPTGEGPSTAAQVLKPRRVIAPHSPFFPPT